MKVKIEIECDTISELTAHLTVLRAAIKRYAKRLKLDPLHDDLPPIKKQELDDANCYGEHYVTIKK